ncbi:bifunctional proline dehydrogenase/pyrroline-5-carboxylate dehydrogenase [Clavibacter michiganensis subsp. michiganensis]|uniref:Bifunctional proline dehydrogenase/pyrroline-5-carboxylate dehydrogenase n=1 Tax=Clavibacter michiganensis subsp. michiganensis TaxID=33013 RepID=A0A251XEX3_CLAMM|nr:bifunctional proline dehydrogenase/pyrroline-5-carboxylate dehydrogenase [Clavibacter michiganensis subsp. michiganensis]OUE00970.1 bifunctional proline dehydrogenase/pyrroline-5-carboxylate dehydrogenase [Clavibacter michiganensis subsp. michiganensis]
MQGAIRAGGILGPVLPQVVVPVARRVLREMVGHLIVDATSEKLGPAIAKLREGGSRLNLNLLGEAVLGEKEAARRLAGTRELLARDDVDYVSIKVSSVVSQLSMWAFDEAVDKVVERLTPLYELASKAATPKFINLDMEEYKDLDLTIEVFTRVLDQPQLKDLEAGIVLQAYLPDALAGLQRLTAWAKERRAAVARPSRSASSRARTSPWSRSTVACTTGPSPPGPPRSRPTRTTSACSSTRSSPPRPTP